jgi:hypothetical protein
MRIAADSIRRLVRVERDVEQRAAVLRPRNLKVERRLGEAIENVRERGGRTQARVGEGRDAAVVLRMRCEVLRFEREQLFFGNLRH